MLFLSLLFFPTLFAFEYIVKYDKLELGYYDRSLVKDGYFRFRKYNKTNYCLNVSFESLKDLDGNDFKFTTSAHVFLSNRYRPTGIQLTYNVCEYWKRNLHNVKEFILQFGNLEGCDIKKGLYYLSNFMPEETFFPQNIPLGRYLVKMDVVWEKDEKPLLQLNWFIEAKFKLKGRESG